MNDKGIHSYSAAEHSPDKFRCAAARLQLLEFKLDSNSQAAYGRMVRKAQPGLIKLFSPAYVMKCRTMFLTGAMTLLTRCSSEIGKEE